MVQVLNSCSFIHICFNFRFKLVESIPENLTYAPGSPMHPSTFTGISEILELAEETIEIASFYWSMRSSDIPSPDGSSWQVKQNAWVTTFKILNLRIL